MTHDYNKTELEFRITKDLPSDTTIPLPKTTMQDFPIEKSRLRSSWWIVSIFILCTSLYGFSLRLNHLAPPLILQFIIAFTQTILFSFNSAIVIDLYPGASASATAVNNLVRCSFGAVGVAIVDVCVGKLGVEWAFLVVWDAYAWVDACAVG